MELWNFLMSHEFNKITRWVGLVVFLFYILPVSFLIFWSLAKNGFIITFQRIKNFLK